MESSNAITAAITSRYRKVWRAPEVLFVMVFLSAHRRWNIMSVLAKNAATALLLSDMRLLTEVGFYTSGRISGQTPPLREMVISSDNSLKIIELPPLVRSAVFL